MGFAKAPQFPIFQVMATCKDFNEILGLEEIYEEVLRLEWQIEAFRQAG